LIGVFWLIGKADNNRPTRSYDGDSSAPSQTLSSLTETKPPVGQSLVFTGSQINYCLAEEIRMNSAETVLDNRNDRDVDLFNAMVVDYNSRCGNFRYRSGALESARREVEPYRPQLDAAGRRRFMPVPSAGVGATQPWSRDSSFDPTVRDIQSNLRRLGYDAGVADGVMGARTRSAIMAFQRDSGIAPDGRPTVVLLGKLSNAAPATSPAAAPAPRPLDNAPQASATTTSSAWASSPAPEDQTKGSKSDPRNLELCMSGSYPSLCKHGLLTPDEAEQVAAAERRANFQTCSSGNYPSLCKRSLLTEDETRQVESAERRANLQTCISGDYPSLCKHHLLAPDEKTQVAGAEAEANFRTCISGNYPLLCKHHLLTAEQAAQVSDSEYRANLQTCLSGNYRFLCKHALLTPTDAASVAEAERRANVTQ
jgi:peptidoglycan hydrolase-like protein with peptidoglycan-binding domain